MKDDPIAYRPIKCETCGTSYNIYQPEKHTCNSQQLRELLKEAIALCHDIDVNNTADFSDYGRFVIKAKKILGEE